MSSWKPLLDVCLDELFRAEGRGSERDKLCPRCRDTTVQACIRCEDCFGGELLCEGCSAAEHRTLPFHRIEVCVAFIHPELCAESKYLTEVEWIDVRALHLRDVGR